MVLLSSLMILIGMALLAAALPLISSILKMLGGGRLCRAWRWLRALILLFIADYALFGILQLGTRPTWAELIVSAILMAGGAFVLVVARLSDLTTRDIVRIAALERDVMHDPLTGVFNRRYLDAKLDEEINRSSRSGRPLSTLILDLDHFKNINDTYGHPVGDQAIRHVCALIVAQIRSADTVVRYGGEEFIVIAPDTDIGAADAVGQRMLQEIAERRLHLPDGTELEVTVSIGAAALSPGDAPADLLARADEALYLAKRNGRNRMHLARPVQSKAAL